MALDSTLTVEDRPSIGRIVCYRSGVAGGQDGWNREACRDHGPREPHHRQLLRRARAVGSQRRNRLARRAESAGAQPMAWAQGLLQLVERRWFPPEHAVRQRSDIAVLSMASHQWGNSREPLRGIRNQLHAE